MSLHFFKFEIIKKKFKVQPTISSRHAKLDKTGHHKVVNNLQILKSSITEELNSRQFNLKSH